jgi:hypothetical protein
MSRSQISGETSAWLLQANKLLDEARRLRPGPRRNELREIAKAMRELAQLEARFQSAMGLKRPEILMGQRVPISSPAKRL